MRIKNTILLFLISILISEFAFAQQKPAPKDTTILYKKIETFSKKSKFYKFVYGIFFKPITKETRRPKRYKKLIKRPYSTFEGKIIRKINIELDLIGISPKAVGYKYLAEAIRLIIDKPSNNLCAVIGEKYGKTDSSVERAMQNAINKAWRTSDINDLTEHYKAKVNSDKGVPTLTEFIYYYANKIKNQY